jgi:hypothetical protein
MVRSKQSISVGTWYAAALVLPAAIMALKRARRVTTLLTSAGLFVLRREKQNVAVFVFGDLLLRCFRD